MQDSIEKVKKKGVLSSIALFGQSGYSALLGFASFFLLSLKSSVFVLGIYNTVLATLSFFNYITNLGLGAALVQKEKIDDKDLSSALIFQTLLTLIVVILGILFTDRILKGYSNLPVEAKYIYWSLLISLIFISIKTPPSVLLEKNVEIYKNVIVQSLENTIFYASVIVLTFLNKPLTGIIVGVLLRSFIGIFLVYILKPWHPKLQFSFSRIKNLLSYGLLFQGNSFLALLKDDLLTIYLSKSIGFEKLGYLTFGKKYAEIILRIITDNLNRVFFPIFSKYQKEKDKLSYFVEKLLKYNGLLVFPILIGSLFVFKTFLQVVPGYYEKWGETLIIFYLFILSSFLVTFISPFTNLFNAIGKVKISLNFMLLWTILLWTLTPLTIHFLGYKGIPLAFIVTNSTAVFVVKIAKKFVSFSLRESLKNVIIAIQIMTLYLLTLTFVYKIVFIPKIAQLSLSVLGGAIIYYGTIFYLEGKDFILNVVKLIKNEK